MADVWHYWKQKGGSKAADRDRAIQTTDRLARGNANMRDVVNNAV